MVYKNPNFTTKEPSTRKFPIERFRQGAWGVPPAPIRPFPSGRQLTAGQPIIIKKNLQVMKFGVLQASLHEATSIAARIRAQVLVPDRRLKCCRIMARGVDCRKVVILAPDHAEPNHSASVTAL